MTHSRAPFLAKSALPCRRRTKADVSGVGVSAVTGQAWRSCGVDSRSRIGKLLALVDVERWSHARATAPRWSAPLAELDAFWSAADGRRGCGGDGDPSPPAVLALDELIGAVTPEDVLVGVRGVLRGK